MLLVLAALLGGCIGKDDDSAAADDSSTPAGCVEEGALTGAVTAALTRTNGCGDVSLYAFDDGGALRLTFQAAGYLEATYGSGATGTTEHTWTFPASDAILTLETGAVLDEPVCNDVGGSETVVDRTYTATEGTATLTVSAGDEGWSWNESVPATLVLEGVVFEEGTDRVRLECLTIAESVGWLAG